MNTSARPLAIVTGASSGIGRQLAICCAEGGFDLVLAADEPLDETAADCRARGATVELLQVELASPQGIDELCDTVDQRPIAALLANAGHGLGHAFLDQDFDAIRHVIDTNITGTLYLLHRMVRKMRDAGGGRVLITGSIAGFMPGSYQAVYNASKAFIDSFSAALRNELKGTGITVTCLMPGATDTEFFARADLLDTKLGTEDKADPAEVARIGFKAMMDGEADVVAGLKNKLQVVMSKVTPSQILAEQHRKMAQPGTAES